MKKMNKKFLAGTAFAVGAAAAISACGMPEPTVYGPAPSETLETTEWEETTEEETTPVEETFDPSEEVQEDVYGPPDMFQ